MSEINLSGINIAEKIKYDKSINKNILNNLMSRRLGKTAYVQALNSAFKLKQLLNTKKLNIVTSESLTAGAIAKILVDVPGEGSTVYGGFIVYDTDAKRMFNNVTTKGVYSYKTAYQMAKGALVKSRAMISVDVTGNAAPYPENKED